MNTNISEEEVLALLTRLLARLQQADGATPNGSHYTFVYVAPGAQHVDTVQNQYVKALPKQETLPSPPSEGREKGPSILPEVLATEAAMALWRKAQDAGYVNDNYQPLISRTQSALLANVMATRLVIRKKWKVFETLWHRTKMYKDYYQALDQQQSLLFQDKLKQLFD